MYKVLNMIELMGCFDVKSITFFLPDLSKVFSIAKTKQDLTVF